MARSWQDYQDVAARLAPAICHSPVEHRMQLTVDALWERFGGRGVSWVGFYLDQPGLPDEVRMVLGPCRDKPACSPIGMHGACGQTLRSGQTLIVRDVRDLGPNYIACDSRDQSEIVVPLVDSVGRVWAVLDVDSWEVGAFDQADDVGLRLVLTTAGLMG